MNGNKYYTTTGSLKSDPSIDKNKTQKKLQSKPLPNPPNPLDPESCKAFIISAKEMLNDKDIDKNDKDTLKAMINNTIKELESLTKSNESFDKVGQDLIINNEKESNNNEKESFIKEATNTVIQFIKLNEDSNSSTGRLVNHITKQLVQYKENTPDRDIACVRGAFMIAEQENVSNERAKSKRENEENDFYRGSNSEDGIVFHLADQDRTIPITDSNTRNVQNEPQKTKKQAKTEKRIVSLQDVLKELKNAGLDDPDNDQIKKLNRQIKKLNRQLSILQKMPDKLNKEPSESKYEIESVTVIVKRSSNAKEKDDQKPDKKVRVHIKKWEDFRNNSPTETTEAKRIPKTTPVLQPTNTYNGVKF